MSDLSSSGRLFSLAESLGRRLLHSGMKVTTAESCTGGGVAHALTAVPGSSQWFDAGFVTYANAAKERLLGVSPETLTAEGAVSESVVIQMAEGALEFAEADLAVAVSGIAGPDGGSEDKPVGTVWLAWAARSGFGEARCLHFAGDREACRDQAIEEALLGLLRQLDNSEADSAAGE